VIHPLKIVIFHSYVSLPEGTYCISCLVGWFLWWTINKGFHYCWTSSNCNTQAELLTTQGFFQEVGLRSNWVDRFLPVFHNVTTVWKWSDLQTSTVLHQNVREPDFHGRHTIILRHDIPINYINVSSYILQIAWRWMFLPNSFLAAAWFQGSRWHMASGHLALKARSALWIPQQKRPANGRRCAETNPK